MGWQVPLRKASPQVIRLSSSTAMSSVRAEEWEAEPSMSEHAQLT
jgi:hypothetical protein